MGEILYSQLAGGVGKLMMPVALCAFVRKGHEEGAAVHSSAIFCLIVCHGERFF
jgi:hypothetical protein